MLQGMQYLHTHSLRCHGNLKSSNCLVDSRWVLKLSSYGLHPFKREVKSEEVGEYQKYKGRTPVLVCKARLRTKIHDIDFVVYV